jgi:sugar-specific transcriptional regulator TrmB
MNKDEIIEKLKNLGFKEYEAKVFLVLLKGEPMSASAIAKEAKIIRNSIYDILKSFVDKGYCNEIETNTILNYQVIDPRIILDKIEKAYHDNYKSNVSLLKGTFDELQSLYKSIPKSEGKKEINIELIRGFNKHRVAKYTELLKESRREVLGMYHLNGVLPWVTEELDKTASNLIKKGAIIKSIYMESLDFKILKEEKLIPANHGDLLRVLKAFEKYGEQVRISKIKIPNITVFDREKIFINLSDKEVPRNKQADIIITNRDLAGHIIDLFNFYWENGLTLKEYKKNLESS